MHLSILSMSGEGVILSERVHVYMLDPINGSLSFYLAYDVADQYYYLEETAPPIDSLIIYTLNEAIQSHLNKLKGMTGMKH
ncbi:MAG TPA: hypothetical protein VG847_16750 [Chitinophagaceae bacterium]|nr:hypothetical protein [Chitinophagaceae bacterium]